MFHFTHWLVFAYGFRLKHLYGSSTGGGLQWKERKWRKGFSLQNYHWFTTFMDHFWCWEFQNSRKYVYTVILCSVNENRICEHMHHIALKGHSVIHLGALSHYTKLVEIFIPMGPPWYIMIMCQRILANYFPFQRYWQICLIFNFVLSTERNYATIANGLM